jgi:hypothetical protein
VVIKISCEDQSSGLGNVFGAWIGDAARNETPWAQSALVASRNSEFKVGLQITVLNVEKKKRDHCRYFEGIVLALMALSILIVCFIIYDEGEEL